MPDDAAESAQEPARQPIHNQVFEFFIDRDSQRLDLAGLIAYSLYKSQKREWIIEYQQRNGCLPSEAEVRALTGGYLNTDARLIYRGQAEGLLNAYAETYVEARAQAIREDALNNETLRQARSIEQSVIAKAGLWPSVWAGIISTALWTLLIAILAAAIGPDFFRFIASALS